MNTVLNSPGSRQTRSEDSREHYRMSIYCGDPLEGPKLYRHHSQLLQREENSDYEVEKNISM